MDLSIREISELTARIVGFTGTVEWDTTKKDGTRRKLLDVSRLRSLGWSPHISLEDGLSQTVDWYVAHRGSVRQ